MLFLLFFMSLTFYSFFCFLISVLTSNKGRVNLYKDWNTLKHTFLLRSYVRNLFDIKFINMCETSRDHWCVSNSIYHYLLSTNYLPQKQLLHEAIGYQIRVKYYWSELVVSVPVCLYLTQYEGEVLTLVPNCQNASMPKFSNSTVLCTV